MINSKQNKLLNNSISLFIVIVLAFIFNYSNLNSAENTQSKSCDNDLIFLSDTIIIFAPHPDDETLGFGGIIYEALQLGKIVKVIIVTNGDGCLNFAYFWKNGCPKGEPYCTGEDITNNEIENFGLTRIQESKNALSLLGLQLQDLEEFAYPDGKLNEMYYFPNNIVKGNTNRAFSYTSKQFSGNNLKEDIKAILRKYPTAIIFTTHILDGHNDHSALAKFIELARSELYSEKLSFVTFWSIIHEPGAGNDNSWPPTSFNWKPQLGQMQKQREQRYKPDWELTPPSSMTEKPLFFCMPEILWSNPSNNTPLLRKAIDSYKTQIGLIRMDGSLPFLDYLGWIDKNGYQIGFVKKNHLLWKAPITYNNINK